MEINIIVRNENNLIDKLDKIKYDSKKYNTLESISRFLDKKYSNDCMHYYCEYDIECKKQYLFNLSVLNKKLDLDIDFNELSFKKYYKITKNSQLTINSVLAIGGYGAAGGKGFIDIMQFIFFIKDLIVLVYKFVCLIFIAFFPFYNIRKKYGYGKNFLFDVINYNDTWNYGFLNLNKIKFNKVLEIFIMYKFGYKLKNKEWIKKEFDINVEKYINKYNKY